MWYQNRPIYYKNFLLMLTVSKEINFYLFATPSSGQWSYEAKRGLSEWKWENKNNKIHLSLLLHFFSELGISFQILSSWHYISSHFSFYPLSNLNAFYKRAQLSIFAKSNQCKRLITWATRYASCNLQPHVVLCLTYI